MTRVATRRSLGAEKRELLDLFPDQGDWTEEEYLWLTNVTNKGVEFTDGFLEILPVPTDRHQTVMEYLFLLFQAYIVPRGGKVHTSGLRVQLRPGKIRQPDLCLFRDAKDPRRQDQFWRSSDLVVEVVSEDDPRRDLIRKRREYAQAAIPEYWIANPLTETISVYHLKGRKYPKPAVYGRGKVARSVLLAGFSVNVSEVFDAD